MALRQAPNLEKLISSNDLTHPAQVLLSLGLQSSGAIMHQLARRLRTLLAVLAVAVAPVAQSAIIDVGSQTSTFSGNVRGFWFTAPTDFTITGLGVPTDASTGNFDVALVRLNVVPPLFSSSTNDFTTLHLSRDVAGTSLVDVDIDVFAGDIIGVLGSRQGVNSYRTGPYLSSILGFDVTLSRLGMQFALRTTDPKDLWTEASGSISRVLVNIERTSAQVPEPGTVALVAVALLGVASARRRKG